MKPKYVFYCVCGGKKILSSLIIAWSKKTVASFSMDASLKTSSEFSPYLKQVPRNSFDF